MRTDFVPPPPTDSQLERLVAVAGDLGTDSESWDLTPRPC